MHSNRPLVLACIASIAAMCFLYRIVLVPALRQNRKGMNFELPVFGPGPVVWVGVVLDGDQVNSRQGEGSRRRMRGFWPYDS